MGVIKVKDYKLMVVYGTLMKGNHNDRFMKNAELVGEGKFKGDLYCLGGFPAVIPGEGNVIGEVYKVPIEAIHDIDRLEGYDQKTDDGMYLRRYTDVQVGNETLDALVYIWGRSLPRHAVKWPNGERWNRGGTLHGQISL